MGELSGPMTELYDVFVDWPGRLAREMPGLRAHLEAAGAGRVLDVGCGTGHHVRALLEAGFDAHGADASPAMLDRAREVVAREDRLHAWRLGEAAPASIEVLAPFDAIVSLGNVWPQLTDAGDVARALDALRGLLAPGGLLLLAFKALAPRRERRDPYLPLLKRRAEGEALFFVRVLDFDVPRPSTLDPGAEVCGFHVAILKGEACPEGEGEATHQRGGLVRVWSHEEVLGAVRAAGFEQVLLTAGLDGGPPGPSTEDVVLTARRPRAS